ncbi:alpha-galactosidase [Pseudobacter ginsenosidimutans]|nr:hypothetical protein [Pseudobacter ginsenosidimutans]QEC40182.1 hypothetical protein FSB84_00135 [Pseudobacter ginsenosidimutans]
MKRGSVVFLWLLIGCLPLNALAQQQQLAGDSLVLSNPQLRVVVNLNTGTVSYRFSSGTILENTIAYVDDLKQGMLLSSSFTKHSVTTDKIKDPLGKGVCLNLVHESDNQSVSLVQYITVYENSLFVLATAEARSANGSTVETRNISPVTILPQQKGRLRIPGNQAIFTDYPFDNDNWVDVIARKWPENERSVTGTSYELASAYDETSKSGFVIGSILHDFWKTGIIYGTGIAPNTIDSLIVYGGAATRDIPGLPDSYGGKDGTHDVMPHGTQQGASVYAPLVYLSASPDVRNDLLAFGNTLKKVNGYSEWKKPAPFYWNSFGVEGVLGYEKVMMPGDMAKIVDYIHSLPNFNSSTQPVLSIDSYDQNIYSTEVLKSIGRYGKKKGQLMGFYFIPFSLWTWKTHINESKLTGTEHMLRDVVLLDDKGNYVPYKDGDWGAFPIDPTHPYTRDFIIGQLQKAKAIDAKFIKIDFLSAGALESARRYDPQVRSGIQAYNYGMKMLRQLVDSIMGPDIFITQAISPLFPNQYAHTRFLSTDVHSHLRNDLPGFPHYGSTAASMISATNFWWTQGTLWPYTNMDVVVMKRFQKHKELNEQDVKVRLLSMIVMGSIMGDGSDFRDKLAAGRGRLFLNNKDVCDLFSKPRAFTPLRFPVGNRQDQQLSYYLPGDTLMLAAFNFDLSKTFTETFRQSDLGWGNSTYKLVDILTGKETGMIRNGQAGVTITVPPGDAVLFRLVSAE